MVSLFQENLDGTKIVATQKCDHKTGGEGTKKPLSQFTLRADKQCFLPLRKYPLNSWMCAHTLDLELVACPATVPVLYRYHLFRLISCHQNLPALLISM